MGEMADWTLEQLSDIEWGPRGSYDGFDDVMYDDETDCYIGPGRQSSKSCRYCGKTGLTWGRNDDSWRLFDGGEVHSCPQYFVSKYPGHF